MNVMNVSKEIFFILLVSFYSICYVHSQFIEAVSSVLEDKGYYNLEKVYGDSLLSTEWPWKFTMDVMHRNKNQLLDYDVDWSSTVFIIFIYDDRKIDNLIKAHFKTWLKHLGEGADVVYITDIDDMRTLNEILPEADKIKATCHLYKSGAEKEGKRLRFKVIDGFRHVAEKFSSTKKYFFKMDSDTYLVTEHLLAYLNDLHKRTYPKPVLFGRVNHRHLFSYADGSLYGFNNFGFDAVNQYFKVHKSWITLFKTHDLLSHEDALVTYVYRVATQIPVIHNPLIFTHKNPFYAVKDIGISYHKTNPNHFMTYEDRFYSLDGKKRYFIESQPRQ